MSRARLALLAVPFMGLLEIGGYFLTSGEKPTPEEWASISREVRETHRTGELVVVAPRWVEPRARQALGDEVLPISNVARSDVSGFATALEVGLYGKESPELEGWKELERFDRGPFRLRRLENPAVEPRLFDFVEELHPPNASVRRDGPSADCPYRTNLRAIAGGLGGHPTFPKARFQCPGGEFFNVGQTVIADEKFLPRRCIWAHPWSTGELIVSWKAVPVGRRIIGWSGMYWMIEREQKGAPVELEISVGDRMIGTAIHKDGEGWAPFAFDLPEGTKGPTVSVEFRVRTDDFQHRHFCFDAEMR